MSTTPETPHVTQLIDAYLAGGLEEADRHAVDAHVAGCAACAQALESARRSDRELAELFASSRPADGFEDRLVTTLRVEMARSPRRWSGRSRHPLVRRIAIGVAATVVLGGVGFGMQTGMNALENKQAKTVRFESNLRSIAQHGFVYSNPPKPETLFDDSLSMSFRDSASRGTLTIPQPNAGTSINSQTLNYFSTYGVNGRGDQDGDGIADFEKAPTFDLSIQGKQSGDGRAKEKELHSQSESSIKGKPAESKDRAAQPADPAGEGDRREKLAKTRDGRLATEFGYITGKELDKKQTEWAAMPQSHGDTAHYSKESAQSTASQGGYGNFGPGGFGRGRAGKDAGAANSYSGATAVTGGLAAVDPKMAPAGGPGTGLGGPGGGAGGGKFGGNAGFGQATGRQSGLQQQGQQQGGGQQANGKEQAQGQSGPAPAGASAPVADTSGVHGALDHYSWAEMPKPAAAVTNGTTTNMPVQAGDGTTVTLGTTVAGAPAASTFAPPRPTVPATPPPPSAEPALGFRSDVAGKVVTDSTREGKGDAQKAAEVTALLDAPKVELGRSFRPGETFGESKVYDDRAKANDISRELAKGVKEGQKPHDAADALAVPAAEAGAVPNVGQPGQTPPATGSGSRAPENAPVAKPTTGVEAPAPGTPTPPDAAKPEQKPPPSPDDQNKPPEDPGPKVTPKHVDSPERQPNAPVKRMVIRNGTLQFEVDSFDSALMQMNKIVTEEGGYLSGTSSDKLPNGKVRGVVTLRCPPDHLDTLVLKLRGMGDLKSQRIAAEDVTKHFTDLDSQYRAAKAMEKRLLAIIEAGGLVKDLLEAEKQLGVWREKIEVLEGEMRYIQDQVAWSTLTVELMERDVRTPTAATEQETVNTSVETEDVEKSRTEALKIIDSVKGRVIDSDLKKFEGGQLSATIVADVAPDSAGQVIDRLKQLGKVARLDVSRKTTTQGGTGPIIPGLKVERKETRLQISLYNLANIAPRQSTSLNLAAPDVETAYKAIIEQVKSSDGRVVSSQLNRPKADQTVGTIVFEAPAEKAEVLLGAVRANAEVMRMEVTQNADTQNTTEAKRGFSIQIYSLAHVPARETTTLQLAAMNVSQSFNQMLDAAKAGGGRILTSQLNEQDPNNVTGTLEFEVLRDKWQPLADALQKAGVVVTRNVTRSPDAENTVDSKIRMSVSLIDDLRLSPRETIAAGVATATVADTFTNLVTAAKDAGARVVSSNLDLNDRANPRGTLSFAVPRDNASKFEAALKAAGVVVSRTVNRQADGPMNVETKVGFSINVFDELQLAPRETVTAVVATKNVPDTFNAMANAAREAGARQIGSNLDVSHVRPAGDLYFSVPRENASKFEDAMKAAGLVINRTVTRQQDGPMVADGRTGFSISVRDERTMEPRENHSMNVVTKSVNARYAAVLDALRLLDAQVIQSKMEQASKDKNIGSLVFVIRREDRETLEKALGTNADIFGHTVERSQDTQNTVDHRILYRVTLLDADQQPPVQTYTLAALTDNLDKAVSDVENQATTLGGHKITSSRDVDGTMSKAMAVVDVPLGRTSELLTSIRALSAVTGTQLKTAEDAHEGTLSRARFQIVYFDAGKQNPRETVTMTVEAADVNKVASDLEATTAGLGGRKVSVTRSGQTGKESAVVTIDVPVSRRAEAINAVRGLGQVHSTQSSQDDNIPDTQFARVRLQVTFQTPESIAERSGFASGLSLLYSAGKYLLMGLLVVVPLLLILWAVVKLFRWSRRTSAEEPPPPPSGGVGPTPMPT